MLLAIAAALAADQLVTPPSVRARQRTIADFIAEPGRLLAVLAAGALPLAASQGVDTLAAGCAGAVVLGIVALGGRAAGSLLAAIAVGLAAAAPVLLGRLGTAAALLLLLLIAAYDAGAFIVGTGAHASWEGPVAGAATVAVIAFGRIVIGPPPLEEQGVAVLALVVALLAPLGPVLASMLLGDGATPARFVRRIDSLLVAGPVAAYAATALLSR